MVVLVSSLVTFDTGVVCFQVGYEVLWTRCRLQQGRLRNSHSALRLSRATMIHLGDDVSTTADIVVT